MIFRPDYPEALRSFISRPRRVHRRVLALLLVFALLLPMLTACGKKNNGGGGGGGSQSTETGSDTSTFGYNRAEAVEDYSRAIAKKNQEFNFEDAEITEIAPSLPMAEKHYTIMVYMIGSNLESRNGAASSDINEMLASGIDLTDTNLILYTGGSQRWTAEIPCDKNCVVDVSLEPGEWVVASTEKNADMGASQTLSEFINFTVENYPAEHYALILWDHGGGPLWGYGVDELFSGDGLLLAEMQQAMEETPFSPDNPASIGKKLDFVGFDACLMGNIETMITWSKYAKYYVGSEELEPGDGWDYHFLQTFNETDDTVTITSAIVDAYGAYYEAKQSDVYHPDCTLSVTDLSKLLNMTIALDAFGKTLADHVEAGNFATIEIARGDAKGFGFIGSEEDRSLFAYDLVDIHSLAAELEEMVPGEAAALMEAAEALVVKNYTNIDGAKGVSVYYPNSNKAQYFEMHEMYSDLNVYGFSRFFDALSLVWQSAEPRSYTIPAMTLQNGEYLVQLDPALYENVSKVTYTILSKRGNGEYMPFVTGCAADVDENGVVHLPQDPMMVVLTTGDDFSVWSVSQAEKTDSRIVYQTRNTRLSTSGVSFYLRNNTETCPITIVLAEDRASGKLTIQTVNGSSEGAMFSGKDTVDVTHYDSIYYYSHAIVPTLSAGGDLLPVSNWEETGVSMSVSQNLSDSFGFDLKPLSECGAETYYVLSIEDVYGTIYTANPQRIQPEVNYTLKTVDTKNGSITFAVFEKEAYVASYEGADTVIHIPEKVDGVPVTVIMGSAFGKMILGEISGHFPVKKIILPSTIKTIGENAFYYCYELEEINLPEGLEGIGNTAFGMCEALKKLELPSTLTYIGEYAFHNCSTLTSLTFPSGIEYIGEGVIMGASGLLEISIEGGKSANGRYEIADGLLYDQETKTVLGCLATKTGTVTVAPGTKRIGADAFSFGALSEVILPEGLETIENYGFYQCRSLAMPKLPESLKTIGHYAFCAVWYDLEVPEIPADAEIIHIGKNVSFIGETPFSLFSARAFEVDPDNARFSSVDGALMNKNGDALLAFAWNQELTLIVPDGCATFSLELMDEVLMFDPFTALDAKWHVYIPDSVIRIPDTTLNEDDVVFHCTAGSYAEQIAEQNGITVSYDTEPARGTVTIPTDAGEMTFWITDHYAVWIRYEGEDTEITVPETVEGLPVTIIGDGYQSLEETYSFSDLWVTLPDTIEIIQPYAFEYSRMELKNIPDSIRVIGASGFEGIREIYRLPSKLEYLGTMAFGTYSLLEGTITLPKTLTEIEPGAFSGLNVEEFVFENGSSSQNMFTLRDGMLYDETGTILLAGTSPDANGNVTIPDGTEVIGERAFYYVTNLTSVSFPDSVREIGAYAFAVSRGLEGITFGDGLEIIGNNAFTQSALTSVTIPATVKRVEDYAFYDCTELVEAVLHAEYIGVSAFSYCESLKDLTLGEGIKEIGDSAFYNTIVSKISLPDSLVRIGERVFNNYDEEIRSGTPYKLKIGPNLIQIGQRAFDYLPISEFEVAADNPSYSSKDGILYNKVGTTLLMAPSARSGKFTVPDGVYMIKAYSFAACLRVTDVTIPDSVEIIDEYAFSPRPWDETTRTITIHCSKDSYAYQWATGLEWPVKTK